MHALRFFGRSPDAESPRAYRDGAGRSPDGAFVHGNRRSAGAKRSGLPVSGKVLERLVDNGQAVKRGQPLMRIDPTDLRLAARAREEAVTAAAARARQTAADETRYRGLVSEGA